MPRKRLTLLRDIRIDRLMKEQEELKRQQLEVEKQNANRR